MNIAFNRGKHPPMGSDERWLLPSISYFSTYYCRRYPPIMQAGVKLYWGLRISWWRWFAELKVVTGRVCLE